MSHLLYNLRLDDVAVLDAVVSTGSMTGAAKRLRMTKQTVSRRIAELEDAVGEPLLVRTTRSMSLTDYGRLLLARCGGPLRELIASLESLDAPRGPVAGTLRVSTDQVLADACLPRWVSSYALLYPEVRVEVVVTDRAVDLFEEGIDVAIRVSAGPPPNTHAHRLAPAVLRYCASPEYFSSRGHPAHPRELAEHATIALAPAESDLRWPFVIDGAVAAVPISPRVRTNRLAVAVDAAVSGLGILNVPEFVCHTLVEAGLVETTLDEFVGAIGSIWCLARDNRRESPTVAAFADLVVADAAENGLPGARA